MLKNRRTPSWKPEANDIIIPIMGPTGAGKSTFINFIAGKDVTTVGHDLESCTATILPVVIRDSLPSDFPEGRRLVLVDTPGFGDTHLDNTVILQYIGTWLETMYDSQKGETKLAGIVYLHDISLTRMLVSTEKSFDIFEKLCGKDALKRVVLCTTKWSDIYQDEGAKRTEQLEENRWKEMIYGGSTVAKFEDSQESAWGVIAPIIEKDRYGKMDALEIQQQLVIAKKLIPETEAGQQLRYSLDGLLKLFRQASSKDSSRRKELDDQIAAIRDFAKSVDVPVTQRILRLLDFVVDKVRDIFMPSMNVSLALSPSRGNKLLVPAVGARLEADVEKLVMLLGETDLLYKKLITLSDAEITNFGSDKQATTEVRCWSVTREDSKPLFVVAAPSFDSHQGGDSAIFEKVRSWLSSSCREDMIFGIIYLRSRVHPPSSELGGRALELVKQSGLQSNILFASFASEATGTVKYGFDGSVASPQETSEQALEMFDIALGKPVKLDLLLEELRTISEVATNGKGKGSKSRSRALISIGRRGA